MWSIPNTQNIVNNNSTVRSESPTMNNEKESTQINESSQKKNKTTNTIELLQKEKPPVILKLNKDDKSAHHNIKINLGVGIGSSQRKESATNTKAPTTSTSQNNKTENILSYVKAASNGTTQQHRFAGIIPKDKFHQQAPKKNHSEEEYSEEEEDVGDVEGASEQIDLCNVFVKYLPQSFTAEELEELFSPYGKIMSCRIMMDKQRENISLGYGFVRFENDQEASAAIEALNGKTVGTKRLLCKLSNNRVQTKEKDQQSNLFIRNIPPHYDEEALRKAFEVFGTILDVKIMTDNTTQKSKGFGFCKFEKPSDALTAIQQMNGTKMDNDDASKDILPLVVKFAETEQEKQKRKLKTRQVVQRTIPGQNHHIPNPFLPPHLNSSAFTGTASHNNPALFPYPQHPIFQPMMMNPSQYSNGSPLMTNTVSANNGRRGSSEQLEDQDVNAASDLPNSYQDVQSHLHHFYYGHLSHMQHMGMQPFQAVPKENDSIDEDGTTKNDDSIENAQREGADPRGYVQNFYYNYNPYFNPYQRIPQYYPPSRFYDEALVNNGEVSPIPKDSSNNGTTNRRVKNPSPNLENTEEKESNSEAANLFIFHLPGDVDDEKLYELFYKFGDIDSVKVIRDPKTNLSKGYGFVKYREMSSAIEAVSQMNGYQIGKKHLKVSFKTDSHSPVTITGQPQQAANQQTQPKIVSRSSPTAPLSYRDVLKPNSTTSNQNVTQPQVTVATTSEFPSLKQKQR